MAKRVSMCSDISDMTDLRREKSEVVRRREVTDRTRKRYLLDHRTKRSLVVPAEVLPDEFVNGLVDDRSNSLEAGIDDEAPPLQGECYQLCLGSVGGVEGEFTSSRSVVRTDSGSATT